MERQEFNLNMDAEVASRAREAAQQADARTATELQEQIAQLKQGLDGDANPLAFEKMRRDADYQRQMETLPQPDGAPNLAKMTEPENDALAQIQQERDAALAEVAKYKRKYGMSEGSVGQLKTRIQELEQRVYSQQPQVDVRAMTGKDPNEPLSGQEIVNLLMAQSQAFGNTIRQVREELAANAQSSDQGLPLDLEAELTEKHTWLTDLPRPAKLRAMHDILSQAGISIAPQAPQGAQAPTAIPSGLPAAARTAVRQTGYIEPSNKGSVTEQRGIIPERQQVQERLAQLASVLQGEYKPGQADQAAKLLAELGAGPVDDSQQGVFARR